MVDRIALSVGRMKLLKESQKSEAPTWTPFASTNMETPTTLVESLHNIQ